MHERTFHSTWIGQELGARTTRQGTAVKSQQILKNMSLSTVIEIAEYCRYDRTHIITKTAAERGLPLFDITFSWKTAG